VYKKEFLGGKKVSEASREDLEKAIRNDKARVRRKRLKQMAALGLLGGVAFGSGYAIAHTKQGAKLQRARGAVRVVEPDTAQRLQELEELLEKSRMELLQKTRSRYTPLPAVPISE
jgi:hypothetical protein